MFVHIHMYKELYGCDQGHIYDLGCDERTEDRRQINGQGLMEEMKRREVRI